MAGKFNDVRFLWGTFKIYLNTGHHVNVFWEVFSLRDGQQLKCNITLIIITMSPIISNAYFEIFIRNYHRKPLFTHRHLFNDPWSRTKLTLYYLPTKFPVLRYFSPCLIDISIFLILFDSFYQYFDFWHPHPPPTSLHFKIPLMCSFQNSLFGACNQMSAYHSMT